MGSFLQGPPDARRRLRWRPHRRGSGASGWGLSAADLDFSASWLGSNLQTTFTEESSNALVASMSGIELSTDVGSPFDAGETSLRHDNVGCSCLFSDATQLRLGGNDFTISFWYNPRSGAFHTNTYEFLLGKWVISPDLREWYIGIDRITSSNNRLLFSYTTLGTSASAASTTFNVPTEIDLQSSDWKHVYLERTGDTLSLWVNGTFCGANTLAGSPTIFGGTAQLRIGGIHNTINVGSRVANAYFAETIIHRSALGLGGVVQDVRVAA